MEEIKNSKEKRVNSEGIVHKKIVARDKHSKRRVTPSNNSNNEILKTQIKMQDKSQEKIVEKTTNIPQNKPKVKEQDRYPKKHKVKSTNEILEIKEEFSFKKDNLKIIPLGGIEEIGKNITVFEYGNDIVIVDCGVAFPEDEMLGIDLVIPDFTYLEKNKDKIRGLVITHGHEDHIGSIAYLLKRLNIPIFATKLTIGLISNKLEEHKLLNTAKLNVVKQGQTIVLGKMRVEFIRSCHSIPDSVALAIHTPVGTVVHTGDFKIDYTPIDDQKIDLGRLAELGNKGVLALLSDSTNAERRGYTMSESTVGEVFDKLFMNCKKRIVIATFASNMHRIQQIVNSAVANNRKIAVCGRSMINMIRTSVELRIYSCTKKCFYRC